jgi:hypothetical protein
MSDSEVHGEKLSVARRQTKDITNRLKPNIKLLKASRLIDVNFVAYLLIYKYAGDIFKTINNNIRPHQSIPSKPQ